MFFSLSCPPGGAHFDRVRDPFEHGSRLFRMVVGSAGPVLVNRPILRDVTSLCMGLLSKKPLPSWRDSFDSVRDPFEYGSWLIRMVVGSAGPVLVNRHILLNCDLTLYGSPTKKPSALLEGLI